MITIDDTNFLNAGMRGEEDSSIMAIPTDEGLEAAIGQVFTHSTERRDSGGLVRMTSAHRRDSVSTKGGRGISIPLQDDKPLVKFDLEQPWQRSLLHELQRMNNNGMDYNKEKSELALLSHSGSHDNLMEIGRDDISVGTNSSLTVPTKSQLIHRSSPQKASLLSAPVSRRDASSMPTTDDRDEIPTNPDKTPPQSARKREGTSQEDRKGRIPDVLPRNRSSNSNRSSPAKPPEENPALENEALAAAPIYRARTLASESNQDYLEVELSDDAMMPDGACGGGFCWGYNVLDFWLQPNTPQYRRRSSIRHSRKFSTTQLEEILEDVGTIDVTRQSSKGKLGGAAAPQSQDPSAYEATEQHQL